MEATEIAEKLIAEQRADSGDPNYFDIACVFALCGSTPPRRHGDNSDSARTVRAAEKTAAVKYEPSAIDEKQRNLWASRALELLRLEQDRGGFKRLGYILWLQKDPDFAGMRVRADFLAFIRELLANTPAEHSSPVNSSNKKATRDSTLE
jgi:hypothetical protein